ncbi:hypothetical protein QTP86_015619, partial [Hemibagrus guttatus]
MSGDMAENGAGLNDVGSAEKKNADRTEDLRTNIQWPSKSCLKVAVILPMLRSKSSEMSQTPPQSPASISSTAISPDGPSSPIRQKLRQALGGQVVLPDDWETTAEVIRETGRKVLGVSSGRRKEDKETWWWNEEVQDSIQRKRLAKKKWDMDRTEENRQEYKELQRRVKREVSKAKQKAYDELYLNKSFCPSLLSNL